MIGIISVNRVKPSNTDRSLKSDCNHKKMKMKNLLIAFVLLGGLTIISASCRTTVVTRPAEVVVKRPPAPRAGLVWIDGGWYRSRGVWVRKPGHWVSPRPGRIYVPGHWIKTRRGYYWKNGYWR